MTEVRFSVRAQRDVAQCWSYWAERVSEEAATAVTAEVGRGVRVLARQPGAGRSAAEYGKGIRVLRAERFLIYYRRSAGTVVVVRVISGERAQERAWGS